MLFALPTSGHAAPDGPIAVTASGGCKVWMQKPNGPEKLKASWTGKCDGEGFATGEGKLFLDGGMQGTEAFVGEVREGKEFTGTYYQNRGLPCLPKRASGQMTQSERDGWFHSDEVKRAASTGWGTARYPCRNDNWFVEEMKMVGGKGTGGDSVWYFGTDAQRVADQTGVGAFAANVRAQAPKKREAPKGVDDACAKTQIVNGKKLCVE